MRLGWEGQTVLSLMLRKMDRAGIIDDVRDGADLCLIFANGIPEEVAQTGLERLAKEKVVLITSTGILMPNFLDAQETTQTDAQRQRECRARRRDQESLSRNVTVESQNVTERSQKRSVESRAVTSGHSLSQPVTPSVPSVPSVPNRAVPETNGLLSAEASGLPRQKVTKSAPQKTDGALVWEAYSDAYRVRYGTAPVRNEKANSICKSLCTRIPADEAPRVAKYYLGTSAYRYANAGHPLAILLQDAEKLRTEWATGNRITHTWAIESDRLQKTGDDWGQIIAEHTEKERKKT
jgi:hypothetical protein